MIGSRGYNSVNRDSLNERLERQAGCSHLFHRLCADLTLSRTLPSPAPARCAKERVRELVVAACKIQNVKFGLRILEVLS
eukprot:1187582-Prorocentrum_minimum.AAC.5